MQSQKIFVRSHDRKTMTFRNSGQREANIGVAVLWGEHLETAGGQGGEDILEEEGGGVDVHHEHHGRVQKEIQLVHVVIRPNRHIGSKRKASVVFQEIRFPQTCFQQVFFQLGAFLGSEDEVLQSPWLRLNTLEDILRGITGF